MNFVEDAERELGMPLGEYCRWEPNFGEMYILPTTTGYTPFMQNEY